MIISGFKVFYVVTGRLIEDTDSVKGIFMFLSEALDCYETYINYKQSIVITQYNFD